MRKRATRALVVGSLVVVAGLLSACSGEQEVTAGTTGTESSTAPSTSAGSAEPEPSEAPEPTSGEGEDTGEGGGEGTAEGGDTSCGKVAGTNGQVEVVAVDTVAGTVGCVEAINVITKYFADAPTKGEGTAYTLTVDGWSCLTDSGVQGSGAVGCDKEGLAFHTQP